MTEARRAAIAAVRERLPDRFRGAAAVTFACTPIPWPAAAWINRLARPTGAQNISEGEPVRTAPKER